MQWEMGGLNRIIYQDYDLIGRSFMMKSNLCALLIPGFDLIKTAMENGALGSGISGSGPSILSKGRDTADKVAKAMSTVYDEMKLL
jgi:homoserine kinase